MKQNRLNNIIYVILILITIISCNPRVENNEKISQRIDSFFESLSENYAFNGNVLVAKNGKVLYSSEFGYANFISQKKLTSQSVFDLASITKQFTALAIAMLKEEGKLDYSDEMSKFFPELPYQGITIKHLLNHTSGIPDFYNFMEDHWDKSKVATNKDVLKILQEEKIELDFKTGESWKYSNTGYVLLALIIEKVSGNTYQEFMANRIFTPLAMNSTWVKGDNRSNEENAEIAKGYIISMSQKGYLLPENFEEFDYLKYLDGIVGDGNILSTTEDLLKYDDALNSGKIVSLNTLQELYTPGLLANGDTIEIELKGQSYGYGWRIRNSSIGKIVWHSGHLPGISNLYIKNPDNGITIIILSNNGSETYKIYDKIFEIITDKKMENPRIFGDLALRKLLAESKIADIPDEFMNLTNNSQVMFYESQLNNIGYELIELKRLNDAIEVFKLIVKRYPKSANAFDSLGEAFLLIKNNKSAIECYEKALELDPNYGNASNAWNIIAKHKVK
ncbi:MAG: serine hydrolase [Bacteroidetes bacterium]|nr:serine hydrolase [Bacteroidota bacterium]